MPHLKCDEWPDDDEPTTYEQQVRIAPAVAAAPAFLVENNRSRRRWRARQRRNRPSAAVVARRARNRMDQRVRPARSGPAHLTEAPDLLARIVLNVPCASCGDDYPVPVRDVLDAQETLRASAQMWTDGCPNYCREPACDLQEHARLLSETDARNLERNVADAVAMLTRAGFAVDVSSPGAS